jgi:hypothetical protein
MRLDNALSHERDGVKARSRSENTVKPNMYPSIENHTYFKMAKTRASKSKGPADAPKSTRALRPKRLTAQKRLPTVPIVLDRHAKGSDFKRWLGYFVERYSSGPSVHQRPVQFVDAKARRKASRTFPEDTKFFDNYSAFKPPSDRKKTEDRPVRFRIRRS